MNFYEVYQSIEDGIRDVYQSDRYQQYLKTMSRFPSYSVNNCILIYQQRPDATLVAGYQSWRKNFERNVRKGERGIRILAPIRRKKKEEDEEVSESVGFRTISVFDVSQTVGKPLPSYMDDRLEGTVEDYEEFINSVSNDYVVVSKMPEFESDFDINLNDTIAGLGADSIFAPSTADLSGMAGNPGDIYVSKIIHKTHIEVDRQGTRAAAATIVMETCGCVMEDGSTLNLSGRTGYFTVKSLLANSNDSALNTTAKKEARRTVQFASGAIVTVNLAGRTDLKTIAESESNYIVKWDSTFGQPTTTTFRLDAGTAQKFKLKSDATGLRLNKKRGLVIIVK